MDALKFSGCAIPGVRVLRAVPHEDARGMFADLWEPAHLPGSADRSWRMAVTCSEQWVVRGLHYQLDACGLELATRVEPRMAKVVTCLRGEVRDVLVDLRLRSHAFGRHATFDLVAPVVGQQAPVSLYVPPGVAHGYVVLSRSATVLYGFSARFDPSRDRALLWNDPALGIDWGILHGAVPILSAKDAAAPTLEQYISGAEVFDEDA